jgi:hypothetical protein
VTHDLLTADVVVEPGPQSWPGTGDGFMGQDDAVLVRSDEPGSDQQVGDGSTLGRAADLVPRDSSGNRFAAWR